MKIEFRRANSILTKASGFLRLDGQGYTHTANPATGCLFGTGACGVFCYAQKLHSHLFSARGPWGEYLLIKENSVALLRQAFERASRRDPSHPHHIRRLRIFASPATEPIVGPTLTIYRQWLELAAEFPIARWVIQTRSPLILELRKEVEALGPKGCISFTLETDSDEVWCRIAPVGSPLPSERRNIVEALRGWKTTLNVAISPCLPLEAPEAFAYWVASFADFALVDTLPSGDGTSGRRTSETRTPEVFKQNGWDWRDETTAGDLLRLLRARMGDRAAWSQQGFIRLAEAVRGART